MLIFSFYRVQTYLQSPSKSKEYVNLCVCFCTSSHVTTNNVNITGGFFVCFFCSVGRGIPPVLLYTVIPNFLSAYWVYADTKRY